MFGSFLGGFLNAKFVSWVFSNETDLASVDVIKTIEKLLSAFFSTFQIHSFFLSFLFKQISDASTMQAKQVQHLKQSRKVENNK